MLLPIVLLAFWILLLVLFNRLNIHFFVFLAGSIGLFIFLMYFGASTAEKYLQYAVACCISILGRLIGLCVAYPEYSLITVYHGPQAISFFVDYECSGFIETLVYFCLLAFYPIYRFRGKIICTVIGAAYIFICNVIRVFVICSIIKLFGTRMFFFSHTVFARVLFFVFMVVLFYAVFTRPHIIKQKVGDLSYGQ